MPASIHRLSLHLMTGLLLACIVMLSSCSAPSEAQGYEGAFIHLSPHATYLVDSAAQFDAREAIARVETFVLSEKENYNFGMSDDALWVMLDIPASDGPSQLLNILEPRISYIEVYRVMADRAELLHSTGQARPFDSKGFRVPAYQFTLAAGENQSSQYLLRIVNSDKRNIPIYLSDSWGASKYLRSQSLIHGLYFGLLLVMILYNSFVYLSVRDKNYLYYIFFLLLISLAQGHMSGLAQEYLFPDFILLKVRGSSIFSPAAGLMAILFIMHILNTRKNMPVAHKFLYIGISAYLIAIAMSVFTASHYAYVFMQIGNLVGSLTVFICAIIAASRGSITARYILIGWSFLITGIVLYVLTQIGVLDYNYRVTPHLVQMGSVFEVLFFSFALAERINRYKEERLAALADNERLLRDAMAAKQKSAKQLAEMEITALRSQMNPHFVFNALGAIQYHMQMNETKKADLYLTKFALLMRKYLESSRVKLISLREEIDLLRLYTDLEMLRFGDKFSTEISIDEELDLDFEMLPSMLVQPFVENAIKHGLDDRLDKQGQLIIHFAQCSGGVCVKIIDNGVGMDANHPNADPEHISRGMQLIRERILTYDQSEVGNVTLGYEVTQAEEPEYPGTTVKLTIAGFNEEP